MRFNYPFFMNNETGFENERKTISGLMDEGVYLHGAECVYYDMTLAQPDEVFGEYLGKKFSLGTPIRLLIDQIEDDFFPEDGFMHAKFGMEFQMGEATFRATIDYFKQHGLNPKPQDVILYKKVHKLFEITHITLINDFNYQIDAVLYNYDHVEIDDTVQEADLITLKDINDEEVTKIIEPMEAQEDSENVIDEGLGDGLFD